MNSSGDITRCGVPSRRKRYARSLRMQGCAVAYEFDLFLSYRREPDLALSREVERFLEAFHLTPVEVEKVGVLRPLAVCVDGSDFFLPPPDAPEAASARSRDVNAVLERYLSRSKELLVLCSRAAASPSFVDDEVGWFLAHRGAEWIRLAFTEGEEPVTSIEQFLPPSLRGGAIATDIAYDLRGYDTRRSRAWRKVPPFQEELVRLACDLLGKPAGVIAPSFFRAELERVRASSLQIASSAGFESLLGDPARALLGAVRAHELHPSDRSERVLRDAYRAAILHHVNRQASSLITGSGPSYLAGRWKQGEVFVKSSSDGRWRALVTERGKDGPSPPGDVYLVSNETQRAIKLEPPEGARGRVEDVCFDRASQRLFVTRYFELIVYALDGRVVGRATFSRWTKSPVPLVDGYVLQRFIVGADSKGGLWLVDPADRQAGLQLRSEWSRDAVVALDVAPDGSRLAIVLESTKAQLIELEAGAEPRVVALGERGVLCARFMSADVLVAAGEDGRVRRFERADGGWSESSGEAALPAQIEWVARSDDGELLAAVGTDRRIFVLDEHSGALRETLDYAGDIDWRAQLVLPFAPVREWPADPAETGEPFEWPAAALPVEALRECGGERWILTSEPEGEYVRNRRCYRLVEGQAWRAADAAVDVRPCGPLTLLPSPYEYSGRALWHDADGVLRAVPSAAVSVRAAIEVDDAVWIATSQGLHTLRDGRFERASPADWDVRDIVRVGGRLWVRTRSGVFVIDAGELVRVTEAFVEIAAIVEAGGAVWLVRALSAFGSDGGPAIRVDGWITRELPGRSAVVASVIEAAGAAWVSEEKRVHRVSGGEIRCIGGLDAYVESAVAAGSTVWVTTRSRGLFASAGPIYRIADGATQAQATDWSSTQLIATPHGAFASYFAQGARRCARLEPDGADELDLGGATLHAQVLIDDRLWLATSRGAVRIEGREAVRVGPDRPVRGIQKLEDALWILGEGWAARADARGEKVYPTGELAAERVVRVDGSDWLLTTRSTDAGPALRVGPDKLTRFGPRGGGVRDVVHFADATWLLTSAGGRPGPARRWGGQTGQTLHSKP